MGHIQRQLVQTQPSLLYKGLLRLWNAMLHAAAVTIHSHYRGEIPEAISSRRDNTVTLDQRSEPVVVFAKGETGLSFKIKMV